MRRLLTIIILGIPLFGQYLITTPDSLLNNGGDYLIITHPNFTSSLNPLCRLRDSLGLQVKMVQTDLIYAAFPDTSPAMSIRLCLQRIYYYWNPRPTYILLVGDAQRGGGANDFIPCKLFPKFSYPYAGGLTQHSTDNWFVTLEGNDSIPDLIIGRLPVNTAVRTESLVAKIIRYETQDPPGLWHQTVLVNSSMDREVYANGYISGFFQPAGDSVIKIYESQGNTPSLRTRHIQAINQGVVMVFAVCHGAQPPAWYGPSYNLFLGTDIPSLTNAVYPVSFQRG
jgi:hypothetical protein